MNEDGSPKIGWVPSRYVPPQSHGNKTISTRRLIVERNYGILAGQSPLTVQFVTKLENVDYKNLHDYGRDTADMSKEKWEV